MPDRSLALARYYPASELDTLAQPLQPILLPDLEDELPPNVELEVYIDYQGVVQRVVLPAGLDEHFAAQVMQRFQTARFSPARKDGVAVNSLKRIRLESEDL
jgi:protein TonB